MKYLDKEEKVLIQEAKKDIDFLLKEKKKKLKNTKIPFRTSSNNIDNLEIAKE